MPIDFSQVKTITIPEGSVTKITDSTGNILWQGAQSEGWHTIWEGSVTSNNETGDKTVANLNALSGTVTLRVTWSYTASGGSNMTTTYYNNNGSTTTTIKPDSPFQFDLDTTSLRNYIVGCSRLANNSGRRCYLKWVSINKSFTLSSNVGMFGDGGVNLSMTVTKIEQYY